MDSCVRASEVHIFPGGGVVWGYRKKLFDDIFIVPGFTTLTILGEGYKLRNMSWYTLKIRLELISLICNEEEVLL
jgi:hypothetical protein